MSQPNVFSLICPGLGTLLAALPHVLDGQPKWVRQFLASATREPLSAEVNPFRAFLDKLQIQGKDTDIDAFAALSAETDLRATQRSEQQFCFFAEPVYLKADRDQMLLFSQARAPLAPDEAQQLIADLNDFLASEAIRIELGGSGAWYLFAETAPVEPPPLSPFQLHGKPLKAMPIESSQHRYWSRLVCELEMWLHQHPVVQQRKQSGLAGPNSLWLWGGGELPHLESSVTISALVGSHPLVSGTAKQLDVPVFATADALQTVPIRRGNVITFCDDVMWMLMAGGQIAPETAITQLVCYLDVAQTLLKRGLIDRIELDDSTGYRAYANRPRWRRWLPFAP